jgi:hypothetical protein
MRVVFVVLISCLSMAACSLQSPTSEFHSNLLGLTQKQILSCLGTPTQKTTEGVAEVWSYAAGQSCFVKIYFAYGRASLVNYVGSNGEPLSTGDECPFVGGASKPELI